MNFTVGPRQSISRRLIVNILLFSSLITLMATLMQLYFDYSRDVGLINDRMSQIKNSYLKSITSDLWAMDREQLQVQIEGIRSLPDMKFVGINVDGKVFMSIGDEDHDNVISNTFDMSYTYNNAGINLGSLTVTASLQGVHSRLIEKALVILSAQSVKTFLVSIFIFLLFYYLVTRHLHKMSKYTSELDLTSLDRPLTLDRTDNPDKPADELDHVVQTINDMRQKVRTSWENLELENTRRLKAERLAGIGEISASIAHEIRNPLTSIVNAVELLRRKQTSEKDREEALALATSESHRLQHILNEFLQFARQRPPVFTRENINELVSEIVKVMQLNLDSERLVHIEELFFQDPCYVMCDRAQIRQVIWNLILNGVQAMPDGGALRVSTCVRDDTICVSVTDTGHGIDEQMKDEVIKPFVTQRTDGTGLGLSVAQKILVDHGTELSISSAAGQGTEVCFNLSTDRPL